MNTTVFWDEVPKFLEAAENNRFSFALSKLNIKSLEMSISFSIVFFSLQFCWLVLDFFQHSIAFLLTEELALLVISKIYRRFCNFLNLKTAVNLFCNF